MTNHPNRSTKRPRLGFKVIQLTHDEIATVLSCITIAAEDGSIYGGFEPGDGDYEKVTAQLDHIEVKLRKQRR